MMIAIDGPAGSGKTTTARALAKRMNMFYLDTGATYRALTYKALEKNIEPSDEESLKELAESINIVMDSDKVYLDGVDVSSQIRNPRIDKNISQVVVHLGVRQTMRKLQRSLSAGKDCVVEGRDTTTVVFPEAEYQFYLDADPLKRAKRRHAELQDKKIDIDLEEVESDLNKRDCADKSRENCPLLVSDRAIIVDTTDLSVEGTVDAIIAYIDGCRSK
jgi:CMP/dCMP kinase